jgi:hypothetical protein
MMALLPSAHSCSTACPPAVMGNGLDSCRQGAEYWAGEVVHWAPGSNDWNSLAGHFTQVRPAPEQNHHPILSSSWLAA